MTHGGRYSELRAEKRRTEFGDELLTRIGTASMLAGEVSIEPQDMASPMTQLMEPGSIPVDRLELRLLRWNLNEVMTRRIESYATANADIGAGHRNDRVDMRQDLDAARKRRRICIDQETVAPFRMKDSEALEKANAAGLCS